MKITKEQKEHLDLWLEALRSGKYQQGNGKLRSWNNYFCCLGVACDISNLGEWIQGECGQLYRVGDDSNEAVLLQPVADWLGMECAGSLAAFDVKISYLTEFGTSENLYSLAQANDSGQFTFKKIADIVENQIYPQLEIS